jgi:hypothetical protein
MRDGSEDKSLSEAFKRRDESDELKFTRRLLSSDFKESECDNKNKNYKIYFTE